VERPLSGVRILDFSRAVAGAYGALLLADLGAEVIKIEQVPSQFQENAVAAVDADWSTLFGYPVAEEEPETPDAKRRATQGRGHFQSINRNKKRIALNLKAEKGKEAFYALVRKSDVVYDNFRPAVLNRLGIDFDTLKQVNPKIISCSVSGYGESGPCKDAPAYDVILQALSGEMSMTGMPGFPPCRSGLAIADLCSGAFATIGLLTALQARNHTGMGQRVDISMLDVMISMLNYRVGQYSDTGHVPGPVGSGHSGAGQIPYGAYECKGGAYIALAAGLSDHWGRFIKALGLPELENDPRFITNAKRQENIEIISGLIEGMFLTKTAQEWEKIFSDADVPAGKVNNLAEAISHPQVLHRNMVVDIKMPTGEVWKFAGNPIKVRGDTEVFEAAPDIGQNTGEILSAILGYSKEHLDELNATNAIYIAPE